MASQFVKDLSKEFALWYTIIGPGIVTLLAIISYNDPEFGFNSAQYGQGILILFLFPVIWCLIFIFCKYLEYKNKRIAELETELLKLKQGGNV